MSPHFPFGLTTLVMMNLFALTAHAPPARGQQPALIPREVLFGNPEKMSPRISPDGRLLAYLGPSNGVMNVWIRTLGSRIVKLHLKDFQLDRPNGRFAWKNLGEGDVNWPEVRNALSEIKYRGFATTELTGGDATYLKDVSGRVDKLLGA